MNTYLFLIILLIWPVINDYKNIEAKFIVRDICILIFSFILILLQRQLHLYEKQLYFSRIVSGEDWNSVYHLIFNNENTFILNIIFNLKKIMIILANNGFEHLKDLGSPKFLDTSKPLFAKIIIIFFKLRIIFKINVFFIIKY